MNYKIPLKKQSKKNKKEYYSKLRKTWNINPISRVVPDKRKKAKENLEIEIYD